MSDQLRAELLKLRTTRTVAIFLLVAVGVTLLGVIATGLSRPLAETAQEDQQRTMFGGGTTAVLMATYVGLIAVTTEFRYGTIRPTLIFQPRRRVVVAAKLVAAALAGLAFGVVCVAASFAAGLVVLSARDLDVALTTAHTLALTLGTIAGSALGAMLGVTIGALIRNQVGAIVALAAYSLAFDAVLFAAVPSVGRFLPGQAGNGLAGLPDDGLLAPVPGLLVVVAWTAAFVLAAIARTDRSDV